MAYSDKVWKDSPDHTTPLSAAGLNDWEARIKAETDALSVLAESNSHGRLPANVRSVTANVTDAVVGDLVLCNATGGAFTVTLSVSQPVGSLITVKKTDASANAVAVVAAGSGTIDGDAAGVSIAEAPFGAIFEHVGANVWQIMSITAAPVNGTDGADGATGTPGTNGTNGTNGADATISTLKNEGVAVTSRSVLDFVGAGVDLTDDTTKLTVTVPVSTNLVSRQARRRWDPTGVIDNFPRMMATANTGALATGQVTLVGNLTIPDGATVTAIRFFCQSTGANAPTNQWFCLCDTSRVILAVTNDDTTTAWSLASAKTLTLGTPYTASGDTDVYAGIMVKATTVPSLCGLGVQANANIINAYAPVLGGVTSASGLTTPSAVGATVASIVAGYLPYCQLVLA